MSICAIASIGEMGKCSLQCYRHATPYAQRLSMNRAYSHGTLGPDKRFVLPKKELDRILAETNGDLRLVEKKLG